MRHLALSLLALCSTVAWSQTDISIEVSNYPESPVILGYYYNNQMLVKDTVVTDVKGFARFTRETSYDEGIYLLFFPKNQNFFDIILGENQKFEIQCDTMPGSAKRMKTRGNKMMEQFVGYQQYLGVQQEKYKHLSDEFKQAEGDTARQSELRKAYKLIDEEVKARNEALIAENKGNCLGIFLNGLRDVDIPSFKDEALSDSIIQQKRYNYYRAHYFDNLPLNDPRMLRTPYIVGKVDKYITEVVPQIPDSVAAECVRVITLAEGNDDTFRYWVSHLYNLMNNSKIMGMDAALVEIADRYYLAGRCPWTEPKFIDDLREQVNSIRYTLIGRKAVDLKKMPSVNKGEYFTLSEVDAPYTILVFWEPSCGHCKKEIPQLKKEVWDKYASQGIKIFAVCCQNEYEPWQQFIEENQLEEWMNVYDPYRRTNFRTYYNIKSTPQIFILDRDKTIVAKRIGVDQIGGFLDYHMNLK